MIFIKEIEIVHSTIWISLIFITALFKGTTNYLTNLRILTVCRPAGRFKILGGQRKNVCILFNFYPIFKTFFSSESYWRGKLFGGQAAPPAPPVPAALVWHCLLDYLSKQQLHFELSVKLLIHTPNRHQLCELTHGLLHFWTWDSLGFFGSCKLLEISKSQWNTIKTSSKVMLILKSWRVWFKN